MDVHSYSLMFIGFTRAYLGPTFANEQILAFHCFGPTGPTLGLPCQRAHPWIPLLWAYWAYLGPILPTSKSLDSIALGLLGLPWAYLGNEHILGFHCSGPTGLTLGLPCQPTNHWIPLLWAYWAYLGPTLPTSKSLDSIALGLLGLHWASHVKEQILGFHWFGPTGPTLGLPCQPRNHCIPLAWAYWAYLGHTLPTSK